MQRKTVWRATIGAVVLGAMTLVPALPVDAVTVGPNVIAVHRNGAVDVPGGSFRSVAKMTLPAGNWTITATGTLQGTDAVSAAECQLVAGKEFYDARSTPNSSGPGSYVSIELLLAHHFAKSGSVNLNCFNSGLTGDVLIRDVHITAVQIGQLSDNVGSFGTGSPRAWYRSDTSLRSFGSTANFDIQDITLEPGTWLVQATAWGVSTANGDRVDCSLATTSQTADQYVGDFESAARSVALEGVVTLSAVGSVYLYCKDSTPSWAMLSSAISALKVGTLQYGPFIGTSTSTGSGTPVVVGRYNDNAGGVPFDTSPQPIGQASLGAGKWFAMAKLSLISGATTKATCQLQIPSLLDQGRSSLNTSSYMLDSLALSATKSLSASNTAFIACDQPAGTNQVAYLHVRFFAIKAGTLKDTLLE